MRVDDWGLFVRLCVVFLEVLEMLLEETDVGVVN